ASFTIVPDEHHVIDTVEGCDGTLTGNTYTTSAVTDSCVITANFITNVENAIRHEDHTLASDVEFIEYARDTAIDTHDMRNNLLTTLYTGVGKFTWIDPNESVKFKITNSLAYNILPTNQLWDNSILDPWDINGLVVATEE
ncbi:hypothetical protein ACW5XW_24580, partial [Aeromonas piscicola]